MADTLKISNFQFGCICFTYLSGFSTLFFNEAKILQQDVWMANVSAIVLSILILWLMKHVQVQYPDKTMTEIYQVLLGKWLGKAAVVGTLLYAVSITVLTLRALSLFYTTAILPHTSPELIMLMLVLTTSYSVYLGLETIVRTVQVMLPLFLISITVICLLMIPNVETNPFLPAFHSRLPEIAYGTLLSYAFPFGKGTLLIFLFHRIGNKKRLMAGTSIGLVLSCAYLLIATYLAIGSLGTNLMKSATFPFFSSIQLVKIGLYLERIEIVIIGIWTVFTLFETIVAHYLFTTIVSELFRIQEPKRFILPFGLLFFAIGTRSYVRPTELELYNTTILPFSTLLPTLILPLILGFLTLFRGQNGNRRLRDDP
ncbi:GerAB/ArcD/ProY family transporter [Cohnella zeiphila]|uniref:Endospore germination permease n=1 Tax=Cohnella zeiphila TaxID=2761120 RepID=A0A7X0SQG8_9BACL|nr:endospore germination permease [Cohnella zeiphila]MBB6734194.1 endospore germination permease [Cohnella zeiphila]